MKAYLIVVILFISQSCFSQDCEIDNNKHQRIINKATKYIQKGRSNLQKLYAANDILRDIKETPYASALKTEIYWLRNNDFKAENEGLSVIEMCPNSFPNVYYFLGEIASRRKDYVTAYIYLQKSIDLLLGDPYYSDAMMRLEKSKKIADIINNPVPFSPVVVGGASTKFDEYLPVLSPDQEMLFFTRRLTKKSKSNITSNTLEEFMVSHKKNDSFNSGKALPSPFNIENNEGGASITIDNKVLYYTKCIRNRRGYNNCDIYYVNKTNNGWSDVQKFSDEISGANTWESQPTVSSDGKTIIFASDRSGGFGKMDLYEISFVDGEWTSPKNLGDNINSSEDEKSPFLHTDGVTLFFSSSNFPTIGGLDIFYSRKDSLGSWSKPINIGYPINTSFNDISLFVSTDGKYAYFASDQLNGIGGFDIYSFPLHKDARPNRVLFLKGELLGENGQIIKDVEIEIKNINTNEVNVVEVDSGSYVTALTLDDYDDILLTVKKEGFAFNSKYISANDREYHSPTELNIDMQQLGKGKSFKIENIYFANNSFEINSVAKEVLLEFADYLKLNNNLIIEINGFTDNIGNNDDNQLLSENRARSVYNMVIACGVQKDRLFFNGYGEKFPISSNDSEEGRALNRRTEFKILSK